MADSLNELFGLGPNAGNQVAQGRELLLAMLETTGTTITDYSGHGRHGVLQGFGANPITTTGPNSWLPTGIVFDGTTATKKIVVSSFSALNGLSEFTIGIFGKADGAGASGGGRYWQIATDDGLYMISGTPLYQHEGNTVTDSSTAVGEGWKHIICDKDPTTIELHNRTDAVSKTDPDTNALNYTGDFVVGNYPTLNRCFDGPLGLPYVFSRHLLSAERQQIDDGPEPVYSSGVIFGDNGVFNVGTWALPSPFAAGSNGTITYEVVAANLAGDTVDSSTSSSGTLNLSSEKGNTVYLLARVSNTGGYDIGDKSTRTSGFGSSGDGYYELASVAVPSGIPIAIRRRRGILGVADQRRRSSGQADELRRWSASGDERRRRSNETLN